MDCLLILLPGGEAILQVSRHDPRGGGHGLADLPLGVPLLAEVGDVRVVCHADIIGTGQDRSGGLVDSASTVLAVTLQTCSDREQYQVGDPSTFVPSGLGVGGDLATCHRVRRWGDSLPQVRGDTERSGRPELY